MSKIEKWKYFSAKYVTLHPWALGTRKVRDMFIYVTESGVDTEKITHPKDHKKNVHRPGL